MSERRWNPVLSEWVVTATHRQERTFLPPAGFCPLCPTVKDGFPTEIPESDYEIVVFENKFPSLKQDAPAPSIHSTELYPVERANGVCEVVLYTSEHDGTLTDVPLSRLTELVWVWKDRYEELSNLDGIEYVFIFENKGEAIGVTIHHPHGQIYAFPFIPPRILKTIESERSYFDKHGRCLHCDIIASEFHSGERVVAINSEFIAIVPFYARYPYEVHIYSRKHLPSLSAFKQTEIEELACLLQVVLQKYDALWDMSIPYIMAMYQQPAKDESSLGSHYRIEFYPPMRTKNKLKYLAGCEAGAGTFVNDTLPEETAGELRRCLPTAMSVCDHE